MKKRYILPLVIGVLVLSGCSKKEAPVETTTVIESSSEEVVTTSEAETESVEETTVDPNEAAHQELYSVLSDESKAAEESSKESAPTDASTSVDNIEVDYSRCVLHDIDSDGIDECFLDTSAGLVMYTLSDGVVSTPIDFSWGSDLYFTDENDCFYVYTNDDGYESWYCYSKGFDNESLYLISSAEFDQYADENDEVQKVVYIDGVQIYGPEIEGYPEGFELAMKDFKPKGVYLAEWNTSLEDAFEVRAEQN